MKWLPKVTARKQPRPRRPSFLPLWLRLPRPETGGWADAACSLRARADHHPATFPFSPPQRFLSDYGLLWVGEPANEDNEDSEDKSDSEDDNRDWMTAKKFWKPGRVGGLSPAPPTKGVLQHLPGASSCPEAMSLLLLTPETGGKASASSLTT